MQAKDNFLGNLPIELAHALFRVAGSLPSEELKKRIETWGIAFIESTALSNPKSIKSDIHILEQLIILGETVGEIPYNASKVLYYQFEKIKSAIRQYEAEIAANSAIDNLFTEPEADHPGAMASAPVAGTDLMGADSKNNELDNALPVTLSEFNNRGFVNNDVNYQKELVKTIDEMPRKYDSGASTERRKLIVLKVRQLGNAAMKDLIAEFPSVSERTIRYDLQKLCEGLVLVRVGNGGPASFYRLREEISEPVSA